MWLKNQGMVRYRTFQLRFGELAESRVPRGLEAAGVPADAAAIVGRGGVATWCTGASLDVAAALVRSEVNISLIIVNFFHKIQNFRPISDLFSQI